MLHQPTAKEREREWTMRNMGLADDTINVCDLYEFLTESNKKLDDIENRINQLEQSIRNLRSAVYNGE